MYDLLLVFASGAVAGMAHVYWGADHLAALVPLAHGRRWRAVWLGLRWGVGHSVGVVLVAIVFLAFRESLGRTIHFESVGAWGERLIGVMLIGLGLLGMRGALRQAIHVHEHEHDGEKHSHLHVHAGQDRHDPGITRHAHVDIPFHGHAAIFAGSLHGIAGMSHLWGVMPSLTLPWQGSLAYLLGFGCGSVLGMGVFASFIGVVTAKLGQRAPHLITGSRMLACVACILVGLIWVALPLLGLQQS